MKKIIRTVFTLMLCAIAAAAYAGSVYDRTVIPLPVLTGDKIWTNTAEYSAVALKRIWIENSAIALNTVTVSRVTADNAYTQAVGAVVTASGSGSQSTLTASYLAYGDKLVFDTFLPTGSTAMVEYELQRH